MASRQHRRMHRGGHGPSFAVSVCLVALSYLFVVANGENASILFSLPAFSMVLQVRKADESAGVFQDRLVLAIREHLIDFFSKKVNTEDFNYGTVEDVALTTQTFWREHVLETTNNELNSNPNYETDPTSVSQNYEVRASFQCQIQLKMDLHIAASSLSQPIMDLLLIEAFQKENYWHLFHLFMSDTQLYQIQEAEISVMANGFRQINPQNADTTASTEPLSLKTSSSGWTRPMKAGIVLASFFLFVLVALWSYLILFVRGTCSLNLPGKNLDGEKDGSVTDEENLSSSDDDSEKAQSEDSTWMDQWAVQITSIPLRLPVKPLKATKTKSRRRPSREYVSHLFQIEESDADDGSYVSDSDKDVCEQTDAVASNLYPWTDEATTSMHCCCPVCTEGARRASVITAYSL